MKIGQSVTYIDEKGKKTPAVVKKFINGSKKIIIKCINKERKEDGDLITVSQITQTYIDGGKITGPCYDPRPVETE